MLVPDCFVGAAETAAPPERTSVQSVGGYSPPVVSVFREFCGKIVLWLRGYGRMPYPPNLCISVQSVGEYLAPETSVGSVASVGR